MSDDEPDPLAEALKAAAAIPRDVVPRTPGKPPTFTPGSVIDVLWPGEMTYDVDGLPTGMTPSRVYRMTADANGILVGWLDPEGEPDD